MEYALVQAEKALPREIVKLVLLRVDLLLAQDRLAKSIPALVPATQRWCIAPKRSEEIKKEGQVNRSAGTLSKSAAMRRRTR